MNTQKKEIEVSAYIYDWVNSRYPDWFAFYQDVNRNRRNGIYLLEHGTSLCDFLNSIIGNIEDHLFVEHDQCLIPAKFSSIEQLLLFISRFKEYITAHMYLITDNYEPEHTSYIVSTMASMADSLLSMFNRCLSVYELEEDEVLPTPYQNMRRYLIDGHVKDFIKSLKSAIGTIPYELRRVEFQESHYHMIVHSMMTLLGFRPLSEVVLSEGRIDMQIDFLNTTYIFEFKYDKDGKQQKDIALRQIIKEGYASKESLYQDRTVIAVGISFSGKRKNINGSTYRTLQKTSKGK